MQVGSLQNDGRLFINRKPKYLFFLVAMSNFKRTNKTDLKYEELLILDALFDGACHPRVLQESYYSIFFNTPYSHSLSNRELILLIQDLNDRGLLNFHGKKADEITSSDFFEGSSPKLYECSITLSPAGGQLWELERDPDWDKYVTEDMLDNDLFGIFSPSLETAKAFFEVSQRCGLYSYSGISDYKKQKNLIGIEWRTFDCVNVISVALEEDPEETDWELYHQERMWWRSINELFSMKREKP